MARRYSNADPTASQAIGAADNGPDLRHAAGCRVAGGPEIHARPWRSRHKKGTPGLFRCPACASSIEARAVSAVRILVAGRSR